MIETINGYTIIASEPQRDGLRMILGMRVWDGETEYVTAQCRNEPTGEWWWGHYFTAASTAGFLDAVTDFLVRLRPEVRA